MIDTFIKSLTVQQQEIVSVFLAKNDSLQSSEVHSLLGAVNKDRALVTVKRLLSEMTEAGLLVVSGSGRSTRYTLTEFGRLVADIDPTVYCAVEPDKRFGLHQYSISIWSAVSEAIFTKQEQGQLDEATIEYRKRTTDLPAEIAQKELERLVIELSWKSSKIEGNTYTLLDTEKLILENKTASGHDRKETQMILNHKDAFLYLRSHLKTYQKLTRRNLEELHTILVNKLGVDTGLRRKPVGVTGSIYRPIDNYYQISEAVDDLIKAVNRATSPHLKALLVLLGISYIQPFTDGNKRTARLMANALLLSHRCAPLSYRSVDENEYREAMLVFYETNSAMSLKKIYIEQYKFAAINYAVK
ncbi:MAG: Fic family protein [Candidatus Berkelbacteria bacterium]|nr:Fic family protein [Candidatus Berkelbacteria bacterium]